MNHDSLITALYELFKNRHRSTDGWISLDEAMKYGEALGFSADNGGRRVRDLYAKGLLEKESRKAQKHGKTITVEYYRYKDPLKAVPSRTQGFVRVGNLI